MHKVDFLYIYNMEKRQMTLEQYHSLQRENAMLKARVSCLEGQLAWYRKQLFGRKSEKHLPLDPDVLQQSLFGEELSSEEQQRVSTEVAKDQAVVARQLQAERSKRAVRKPIDTSTLRVEEEHLYPERITAGEYVELEPETTDTLVLKPAEVYIHRIVRHKYALKSHLQIAHPERKAFEIAALPAAPLHKCMASASILSDIILHKYLYHMPFYRVIQKYRELGLSLSASTLNDWFAATCEKLKPLYDCLRDEVLSKDYIQVDESTVPIIDNEKHRTVKGYMWCVRDAVAGNLFFHYDMGSRSARTAMKLLKDYQGAIQSDGYNVYDRFEGLQGKLMLGCWAHARRKFTEALEENRTLASEALVYIGKLYQIERQADEALLDCEQRRDKRKKEAYPLIITFEKWLEQTYRQVLDSSRIGKAIAYTYAILPKLSRYVLDGRYRIDNNLVENAIRPLAIGRKNYLFCGNDAAALRAAIVCSLIGCCKAAQVDPRIWMEDILSRMPQYELGKKDFAELLPENWRKAHLTSAL